MSPRRCGNAGGLSGERPYRRSNALQECFGLRRSCSSIRFSVSDDLAQLGSGPGEGRRSLAFGPPLQLRACFRNLFGGQIGRNAICWSRRAVRPFAGLRRAENVCGFDQGVAPPGSRTVNAEPLPGSRARQCSTSAGGALYRLTRWNCPSQRRKLAYGDGKATLHCHGGHQGRSQRRFGMLVAQHPVWGCGCNGGARDLRAVVCASRFRSTRL